MKERLKTIRLTLGYSQQEMADKLNIPVRVYRNYEYVSKGYPVELIENLIDLFNINANYLFKGSGSMFIQHDSASDGEQISLPKNKIISDIGCRLSEIQEKNNISDKIMAKKLGIYEYEYIDLKQGQKELTFKIINRIKTTLKISIDWLLFGE